MQSFVTMWHQQFMVSLPPNIFFERETRNCFLGPTLTNPFEQRPKPPPASPRILAGGSGTCLFWHVIRLNLFFA